MDSGDYCTPTTLCLNCFLFLLTLLTPTVLDRYSYFRTLLPCCPPRSSRFIQYVPYNISKLYTFTITLLFPLCTFNICIRYSPLESFVIFISFGSQLSSTHFLVCLMMTHEWVETSRYILLLCILLCKQIFF